MLLTGSLDVESDHAIYISTTYLDISPTYIEAEVRVFEDDLRAAIRSHTGYVTDTTAVEFRDDVLSYFRKYLTIDISMNPITWELQDIELVGDSYRIYLDTQIKSPADEVSYAIVAGYFFDVFPTQKNVLRLQKDDLQDYHIFEGKEDRFEIEL